MNIKESNTVELKQSWQDSYLKTLAAFANSNKQYQQLCDVSKGTATKELVAMVRVGLLEKVGTRGAGTFYRLRIE